MQQHDIQGSSAAESSSTSNIKRYKVTDPCSDYEVWLEVDHQLLTPELAQQINEFWTQHKSRAEEEGGDHVRTVIRMAGDLVIGLMLESGWDVDFAITQIEQGKRWSEKFRDEEGWGGEDGTLYSRCGIRVIAATVERAGFYSLELEEVANES